MVDLFKVSDPSEALGNTITAREILDKGAERIDRELSDQPAIQATLMDTMGTVYTSLGLYGPAARLVREAVARRQSLLGPGHPEVASSVGHLGEVLMLKGEYEEAERNLRASLATKRRIHGPQSADSAQALMLLADVLSRQARYEEAEPLIQEALAVRRALYGTRHPDVAASIETAPAGSRYESAYANRSASATPLPTSITNASPMPPMIDSSNGRPPQRERANHETPA